MSLRGACAVADVCVRVSPPRRQQLSRQEIETCLVKRARRSIHASFWLFHQPARNASISDAAARGYGVNARQLQRCAAFLLSRGRWRENACVACARAATPAALHCPLALYRGSELPAIKSIAASRCWLQNEHPTWSARFRVERFACGTVQLASPCSSLG